MSEKPLVLSVRMARCGYGGSCLDRQRKRDWPHEEPDYGRFDEHGHSIAPSSKDLPFFESCPDFDFDRYYCGCGGWD